MSNTIIQIKRSQTTATPASLAEGELAYSGNGVSNSLFIGLPDGANTVTRIAGGKYGFLHNANTGNSTQAVVEGGTLTANAVLITDANSSVNELRTAKLIINTSGNTENEITSISVFANSTQLGDVGLTGSNTELVTSEAIVTYIDGITEALGGAITNTHVVFSNSSVFAGGAGFTFDYTTNTVSVSNTIQVGANVTVSNSTITIGNSTVNTAISQLGIDTDGTLDVLGATQISNTLNAGNTTVTGFANISSTLAAGNTTITGFVDISSTLDAGNTNIVGFINVSSDAAVGGDLVVDGNTTIGSNSSDIVVFNAQLNSDIIPTTNTTYNLGTASLWYANAYIENIQSTNAEFVDLTVSGNLTVTGTLTTIDTNNLVVEDSLIKLARNNTVGDAIDIGLFGEYDASGSAFTGIFRDASDSGIWKFFDGLTEEPTTTVDTSNATFSVATIQAYLISGGLTTDATSVDITANSTLEVTITANTIAANVLTVTGSSLYDIFYANSSGSLTALALGSDGTVLQSNGTALVYGGLDGGTF